MSFNNMDISKLREQKLEQLHKNLSEMNKDCKKTIKDLEKFEKDPTMENLSIALNKNSTFGTIA